MSGRDRTSDDPPDVAQFAAAGGRLLADPAGFAHVALLYDGSDQDLGRAAAIVRQVTESGAPLHLAATARTMRLVREVLGLTPRTAVLADMAELGRNPARLIPAAHSFGDEHRGQRVCCLWEPAWPGRSSAELLEVARHEALCNLAFSGRAMTIFCLYDTSGLPSGVIADAERTHPVVVVPGGRRRAPAISAPAGCRRDVTTRSRRPAAMPCS